MFSGALFCPPHLTASQWWPTKVGVGVRVGEIVPGARRRAVSLPLFRLPARVVIKSRLAFTCF